MIKQLLEKQGCEKQENNENKIKEIIKNILEKCKKGKLPNTSDLNIIYNSLKTTDHFDCVRIDQILTIIANRNETEFQWGSICLNKKWKIM